MTGSYHGDMAIMVLAAASVGAVVGVVLRRRDQPLWLAAITAPAASAIILPFMYFAWIATTTAIYGHPGGNNPLLVGLAAAAMFAPGFTVLGAIPSVLASMAAWLAIRPPRAKH